jgi:phospholipase/carboxylesterase
MKTTTGGSGPHSGQLLLMRGPSPKDAKATVVLIHGRGGTAQIMFSFADYFERDDIAYVAPQAKGQTWYPERFIAPFAANEPYLSSAHSVVADIIAQLAGNGVSAERVMLLGFSQGACLALDHAVRNPKRYGGLGGMSGGLIGPPGHRWPQAGSFEGTPAIICCSEADPHIPLARVKETITVLRTMQADVTEQIYPGSDHMIMEEGLALLGKVIAKF